jgi:hypothetical protein
MTMCEFCGNQRATNARAERVASFLLTDLKERAGGPKAAVRFVANKADLRPVLAHLDVDVRNLETKVEQLATAMRPSALAPAIAEVTRQVDDLKGQFATITNTGRSSTMKKQEFLAPRSPDGTKGGEVVTANVQSEPNNRVTQYAEPEPYFTKNVDRTPLASSPPETQAEATALETERRSLIDQLEAGTLNAEERATAAQRIQKIEEVLARWRNRLMHDQGHREQVR